MPTAFILRFCICSLLVFTLVFDTSAQRVGRRRSAPATVNKIEEISSDQLGLSIGWNAVADKLIMKQEDVIIDSGYEENPKKTWLTTECRETNGINKKDIADSYPYLTSDGLRLYFTSNREGGHGRFFISTRKTIYDPFTDPKVLSKNLTDGYYAGTLTADELTLFMVKEGSMYISVRADKNSEFPLPKKVAGTGSEYHFGPSISQDGSEIFITVRSAGKDMVRIYKRTGIYAVEEKGKLTLPEGYDAAPGQLSKDGLSFYLSLEGKKTEHLWKYTRTSTADNFANPVEFPEQLNGLRNILQPSVNGDGTIMVFVTSLTNGWDGDDILLVNSFKNNFVYPKIADSVLLNAGNTVKLADKISSPQLTDYSTALKEDLNASKQSKPKFNDAGQISLLQLKVYPNPFATSITIQINEVPCHGAAINIYDQSGKIIKQQSINQLRTSISLDRLSPGIYTYQVVDDKGKLISSGNLVKAS